MPIRSKNALYALVTNLAIGIIAPIPNAFAQAPTPAARSSVLPTGGGAALLDASDTVIVLLDHQAGLFQTVKDVSVAELRAKCCMLANLATLLKIPVITSASEPNGTNGPLMPEIQQFAPHAVYVPRKGEVNAWDNEDFVKAVRATGKKTLDHGGSLDQRLRDVPGARRQSGWIQGLCGDGCFRRPERNGFADVPCPLRPGRRHSHDDECCAVGGPPHVGPPRGGGDRQALRLVSPNYAAVTESYRKAQEVAKQAK